MSTFAKAEARIFLFASLLIFGMFSVSFSLDGTILYMNHNKLLLHNAATGTDLVLSQQVDGGRGCFSPDGREVAMRLIGGAIRIFSVYGGAYRDLLIEPGSVKVSSGGYLTWLANGYIYWIGDQYAAWDPWQGPHYKVYRVSALTGKVEIAFQSTDKMEQTSSLSNDGLTAYGAGRRWDLTGVKPSVSFVGGCGPAISPDGKIISATPPYHKVVNFYWRDTLEKYCVQTGMDAERRAYIDSISLPPEVWEPRFATPAHANSIWLVAKYGYGSIGEKGSFVFNRITKEYQEFPVALGNPCDYWPGPLPQKPATAVISVDKLTLYRSAPGNDTLRVTNVGAGTLTPVQAVKSAPWLTVATPGTAGNSQLIVTTVNASGLTKGVYTDTVKLSAAGASNTVFFVITFAVNGALMAPSQFAAEVRDQGGLVYLSWVDNVTGETGFSIERKELGKTWAALGLCPANTNAYADSSVTATGTYVYRARAFKGVYSSSYSSEATISFIAKNAIVIQSPSPGAVWIGGTKYSITWTADNSANKVGVDISYNGGRAYSMFYGASISRGDPLWGNLPVTVLDTVCENVFLRLYDYANPGGAFATVGPLRIIASTAILHNARVKNRRPMITMQKGGILTVLSSEAEPLLSVVLYGATGRKIHSVRCDAGVFQARIDLEQPGFHSNLYIVKIATTQGKIYTSRILEPGIRE